MGYGITVRFVNHGATTPEFQVSTQTIFPEIGESSGVLPFKTQLLKGIDNRMQVPSPTFHP